MPVFSRLQHSKQRLAVVKSPTFEEYGNPDIGFLIGMQIANAHRRMYEKRQREAKERQRRRGFDPLDNNSIREAVNLFLKNPMKACRIFGPIEDWNTEKVTAMYRLFYNARYFNEDISLWDTGKVGNMACMFQGAVTFDQDIGGWQVGSVKIMPAMFCSAVAFNQDIGGWQVGAVTTMFSMFHGATEFNQDIGGWEVGAVTDMGRMFYLATAFDQDIGGWQVGAVTTMRHMQYMFRGVVEFNIGRNAPWYKEDD
jgi:surface protein